MQLTAKETERKAVTVAKMEKQDSEKWPRTSTCTPSALQTWVERTRADRTGGKTGLTTEERAELAALPEELRIVKMEREILGKAVAIFAKQNP